MIYKLPWSSYPYDFDESPLTPAARKTTVVGRDGWSRSEITANVSGSSAPGSSHGIDCLDFKKKKNGLLLPPDPGVANQMCSLLEQWQKIQRTSVHVKYPSAAGNKKEQVK